MPVVSAVEPLPYSISTWCYIQDQAICGPRNGAANQAPQDCLSSRTCAEGSREFHTDLAKGWKNKAFFFFFLIFIYLFRLRQVLVAARGIFITACGILVAACMWDLVPWPGIKPGPPALGAWSLTHWTSREAPEGVKPSISQLPQSSNKRRAWPSVSYSGSCQL